ncbi:hypothetical protein CC117_27330 [Parafrankia colletiae]|uniref:histidine kinase n=1 Tax=Parafrankia colletiae TaxID=573497 RepID=A0A1S1QEY7_9ACTN|nr:hypothetical protein [Parafrankia colletiae]MCK9904853.1 hypothetical protein [Frankia sp. Cpl3]OHV30834.1 hypothetical protein CC117_27330 [Parafrankia colletiae]
MAPAAVGPHFGDAGSGDAGSGDMRSGAGFAEAHLDPADPADPADLVGRVLRLAAALPSKGPDAGDLTPIAELVGRALGALSVTIDIAAEGDQPPLTHRWIPAATAPADAHADDDADDDADPDDAAGTAAADAVPGACPARRPDEISRPIHHQGHRLGVLTVVPADDDPEHAAAVGRVAGVLGVVIAVAIAGRDLRATRTRVRQALGQEADLRFRAASLLESERHELERDLHDGAQLHLVSLQLAAALLDHQLDTGSSPGDAARPGAGGVDRGAVRRSVADLGARLRRTRRLLADTAAGVMPAPLRTSGLGHALDLVLRETAGVTLEISPDVQARRYPPAVEEAVYFTCLEAVSNTRKHAAGSPVVVTVRDTYHGLWFSITDTGPGLGRVSTSELGYLRSRLGSVGGTMRVGRGVGGVGTEIIGTVPI